MSQCYEQLVTIASQHVDALGHVNNVVYLQWVESLAWQHSAQLGITLQEFQQLDAAMVVRQHELNYLSACFEGDVLRLKTWLLPHDGLNLYRQYEFVRQTDQTVVFEGKTRWVCVRMSTGRPMRMPMAFKQAYGAE